jgi:hypothetical protein
VLLPAVARDHREREVPQGLTVKASLLAIALVTGCYAPETLDCTVTCSAAGECASDQVCGSDGFCAAPEVAGQCVAPVALEIKIDGDGTVMLAGIGDCDSRTAKDRTCTFMVAPNQRRQLSAMPNGDRDFKEWSSACAGETATCEVTPVTDLTRVGAKFE